MSTTQLIISFVVDCRQSVLDIARGHPAAKMLNLLGIGNAPAFASALSVEDMDMDKFLAKLEPFLFDLIDSPSALLSGTRVLIFSETEGVFIAREVFIERDAKSAMLKMKGHVCPFSWGI